ncbi:aminopeptidase n protein [Cystoisospora suis]|uniref:Aminopeptidase n protein n=1 Tax=Cystoisospora suis TaxID=483139 RepID=A0A2C6KLS6_9APIC|nr:aminopeptidase n protein [Cystoisospora suis]
MDFSLDKTETRVKAKLLLHRRIGTAPSDLVFDGEELKLNLLSLERRQGAHKGTSEGRSKHDILTVFTDSYITTGDGRNDSGARRPFYDPNGSLVIPKELLPEAGGEQFTITTEVLINPQANTKLSGLYMSDGLFVTHNEAHGFRRITYFLDRPDVLSRYEVSICADKAEYPVLLSNGDLVEKGPDPEDSSRHCAIFRDPHKKPSYLFALVAGDLKSVEAKIFTKSGRSVRVAVWGVPRNHDKLGWALESALKSMRWDEEAFGREYDLDAFHIACVEGFNAGAMENKGLNIFNCDALLADPNITSDAEYRRILNIIGHEYFHNWSGDRVTVRDWTELTLKEGLTVFRDQEFMADIYSEPLKRIEDARLILTQQFREDGGPASHPIRPDHYASVDNLYTVTVYRKGAEVVRMYRTLMGPTTFREAMDLYFSRNDGKAATCEDFQAAMADASGRDFSQFARWYSRAGTPEVEVVRAEFDSAKQQFSFTVKQNPPPLSAHELAVQDGDDLLLHIPLKVGLIGKESRTDVIEGKTLVFELKEREQTFTIPDVSEDAALSFLRDFSAPVRVKFPDQSEKDLALLAANDSDPFGRWQAGQTLALKVLRRRVQEAKEGVKDFSSLPHTFERVIDSILEARDLDDAFKALILELPSYARLEQEVDPPVVPEAILAARLSVLRDLQASRQQAFMRAYQNSTIPEVEEETDSDDESIESPRDISQWGRRALRSVLLEYLTVVHDEDAARLATKHYFEARVMTDKLAALRRLVDMPQPDYRKRALAAFHEEAKGSPQLMTKWFSLQALSALPDTVERVRSLSQHPDYNPLVPNFARSLMSTFMNSNPAAFHRKDGAGYELAFDFLTSMDKINPRTGARAAAAFLQWERYDEGRRRKMRNVLERLASLPELSTDLGDVVEKALRLTS